ncbi:hypothetical protein [Asaia lannensis]|uniref:hypothetical protein n=1 Tax=Asaia lannensis TaxID=415421 RepID=UPI00387357FC
MTDQKFVPPVPKEKMAEYYEQVENFQKSRARAVVKINKYLTIGLGISLLAKSLTENELSDFSGL